jgi:hypothetical protein
MADGEMLDLLDRALRAAAERAGELGDELGRA